MLLKVAEVQAKSAPMFTTPRVNLNVTAGQYALAQVRAAQGDTDARDLVAALEISTVSENTGMVPPNYLRDIIGVIDDSRPFINSIERAALPASGMKVFTPKLGAQATVAVTGEGVEFDSTDTVVTFQEDTIVKFAGANIINVELVDRSDPSFVDLLLRELAASYAQKTDAYAAQIASQNASASDATTIYGAIAKGIADSYGVMRFTPSNLLVANTGGSEGIDFAGLLAAVDDSKRPLYAAALPDNAAAWVTKVAAENGYDMVVTNWGGPKSYRAQTVKELTPEADYTGFKEIPEDVFEIGDEVFVYKRYGKITDIEGDVLTIDTENAFGNFDRSKFQLTKFTRDRILLIEKAKPSVTTRSQKVDVTVIPGYERMMGEVEGILEKSMNRGGSYNQASAAAIGYIQKSAVYERADDSQREQIIRDFKKIRGEKMKTAPSVATTAPITGGTITTSGTIGITQATTSTDGYLSSTDWNTFNNKQGAGSGTSFIVGLNATNVVAPATTNYTAITGGGYVNAANEFQRIVSIPQTCSLSRWYVRTSATQPASGSLVITLRKNQVDTALAITIAAGSVAGTYSNTATSIAFSAADLSSVKVQNNAAANSTPVISLSIMVTI